MGISTASLCKAVLLASSIGMATQAHAAYRAARFLFRIGTTRAPVAFAIAACTSAGLMSV